MQHDHVVTCASADKEDKAKSDAKLVLYYCALILAASAARFDNSC